MNCLFARRAPQKISLDAALDIEAQLIARQADRKAALLAKADDLTPRVAPTCELRWRAESLAGTDTEIATPASVRTETPCNCCPPDFGGQQPNCGQRHSTSKSKRAGQARLADTRNQIPTREIADELTVPRAWLHDFHTLRRRVHRRAHHRRLAFLARMAFTVDSFTTRWRSSACTAPVPTSFVG